MAFYWIYTGNGGKKYFGSSLWGRASGTVFVPERFNRGKSHTVPYFCRRRYKVLCHNSFLFQHFFLFWRSTSHGSDPIQVLVWVRWKHVNPQRGFQLLNFSSSSEAIRQLKKVVQFNKLIKLFLCLEFIWTSKWESTLSTTPTLPRKRNSRSSSWGSGSSWIRYRTLTTPFLFLDLDNFLGGEE